MKLGNKTDAKLIYKRRKTGAGPLPKGWKKLGEGAYRTSYLSPDKVVYKICHGDEGHWSNVAEFEKFSAHRTSKKRLPKGWRVAKTKAYRFDESGEEVCIIAMEYIEGKHIVIGFNDDDEDIFRKIGASKAYSIVGLFDLHEGNFLVTPHGKKVIIDLGE